MDFKLEEYFVFQDKDIFSQFLLNLENCSLQFINGKLFASNQFINKSLLKGQMSKKTTKKTKTILVFDAVMKDTNRIILQNSPQKKFKFS